MKTHLDLFSGIGGFALAAARNNFKTVAFCKIDPFARKVLTKNFPGTPIHTDITNAKEFTRYEGTIDLLTGEFPCQPFSIAGKQKGTQDDRDLCPCMFRVIQQTQPTWIIGENVAHFTRMAFTRTKTDLESQGYTVQPFIIPACAVQAPYRRDRVWIIAHYNNSKKRAIKRVASLASNSLSHGSQGQLHQGSSKTHRASQTLSFPPLPYWAKIALPTSFICGVADGIPNRMDRIKSLGNAIVPQVAEELIRAIKLQCNS